ncbi:MAG: hypothetical protein M3Q64_00390, partial [bacterium]|nr:hypothetical protein [bacterium]
MKMFRMSIGSLFAAAVISVLVSGVIPAQAAINMQFNYQGKLTNASNVAVVDGLYTMYFKLYTVALNGTAVWTESRTSANKVQVTNGLFSVMLGEISSLSGVDFNQTLYLGVTIEADAEMSPRKKLGAVPAAILANGVAGTGTIDITNTGTQASIAYDASNKLTVSVAAAGTSTINAVGTAASLNLNIGGTTRLAIANSGAISMSALTTNGVVYTSGGTGLLNTEAQLALSRGGTGVGSYTNGDLLYYNSSLSTTALSKLAIGGNSTCLTSNGTVPSWGSCGGSSGGISLAPATTDSTSSTNATINITASGLTANSFINLNHTTSAFTGTVLKANMANATGSFASGNFVDLQTNSSPKFTVDYTGAITVGSWNATAIPTSKGGTGSAFFAVSGPATSTKTFAFPDASATVLTTNAAVTVGQGGTGITSGTSGGIPYFSSTSTIASSGALTASALVLGGGAGATPTSLGLGTGYQLVGYNSGGTAVSNLSLAGSTNQISVGTSGTSITLFTPQNIHTGATPQFARLGMGAAADSTALYFGSLGAGQRVLASTQQASTETSGVSIVDLATIWNNAANTPTAIKLNVTDTASNVASILMDLQVGGVSKFKVDKTGALTVTSCTGCGGGGSVRLDQILAATATNGTGIDNTTFAQIWKWSTLTTQRGLTLAGGTAMTTGTILDVNTTSQYVHTTSETGNLVNFGVIDASTATSGSTLTNALNITSTLNTSGAGTKAVNALNVAAPTLTACASGVCAWDGLEVNFAANSLATVTQTGLKLSPAGSASTAGTIVGLDIGNITAGAASETALRIGTGWDNEIALNDTTPVLKLNATDNTTTFNIADASGNSLLEIRDYSTAIQSLVSAGAFISHLSYIGQEFNNDSQLTAITATANVGDDAKWTFRTTGTTATYSTPRSVGGTARLNYGTTTGVASEVYLASASAGTTLNSIIKKDNLPVMQTKFTPVQSGGALTITTDYFVGFFDSNNVSSFTATNDYMPFSGFGVWSNNSIPA